MSNMEFPQREGLTTGSQMVRAESLSKLGSWGLSCGRSFSGGPEAHPSLADTQREDVLGSSSVFFCHKDAGSQLATRLHGYAPPSKLWALATCQVGMTPATNCIFFP